VSSKDDGKIHELSSLVGIEPEYYDNWGNRHTTSVETKTAILSAMGIEDAEAELKTRQLHPWNRLIEPVMVVSVNDQPASIPVYFPLPEGSERGVSIQFGFRDENGALEEGILSGIRPSDTRHIEEIRHVKVDLPNRQDRPLGYYTLTVRCRIHSEEISGSMRLIITPDNCYMPEHNTWGISINLYALRSQKNWGCGNLTDLDHFVTWVDKELCGGFVGINPLHVIPNRMPYGISPYSSTSRLYRNFIYLDMENVLNTSPEGRTLLSDPKFNRKLEQLRNYDLIDYEGVSAVKLEALRTAFLVFHDVHIKNRTKEAEEFEEYVKSEGTALKSYATFMALEEYLRKENQGLFRWQDWPRKYRDPQSSAVKEFQTSNSLDVLFYQYIQWQVDKQLSKVAESAKNMAVGLYNDLAVGSAGEGSDAWSYPEVFAFGLAAGAPPDAFNMNGQNWGFPPLIPEILRESGYELFIKTIRHNLQYAGALRIDHALGLFRLFWIPEGMMPHEGTYVRYPYEELFRIIALESVRNKAVIISEDLGTIGEEVREALQRFGMLSYRLFYFERDWTTRTFLPPDAYPEMALTAVTTHDLPTLRGFWLGRDIDVKTELNLYPNDDARVFDIETRRKDKELMISTLKKHLQWEPDKKSVTDNEISQELFLAIHAYLARTPCRMVAVSLDDVISVLDQQNMPGTIDTHPNWRQKTPVDTSTIFGEKLAHSLASMFKQEGRSSTPCNK
jgi:4-alpha-glucanotransferase